MNHPVAFSLSATSSLHLITLFTLAVAHPLYDVLGNEDHSSFFATHRAGSTDIWLLVVLLSFALPLAASLLLWSIRAMSRTLAKVVYVAILFALCSALFSAAFGRFLSGNAIAPAALTSAALACLFLRAPARRPTLRDTNVARRRPVASAVSEWQLRRFLPVSFRNDS